MWIGIDFGTHYSSAALVLNGELIKIKDPLNHSYSVPSAVYIPETGNPLVGQSAINKRSKHPERFQDEFKRDLGSGHVYSFGKSAEDLATLVLRYLREETNKILKSRGYAESSKAVITVPATYTLQKRTLMKTIAETAGFEECQLLEEPIAAAIHYANKNHQFSKGIILVYDLGAGTFDVSLIEKEAGGYKNLGVPNGLSQCGGIDFDHKIYQDLSNKCSEALKERLKRYNSSDDYRLHFFIEDQCRELKHQLSASWEAEIIIPGGYVEEYSLNRKEFNFLIQSLVEETIYSCEELLQTAGMTWNQVDQVLLVGGSSRIPLVQETISQKFGKLPLQVDDPELSISLGAATYGNQIYDNHIQKDLFSVKKSKQVPFYNPNRVWE